MSPLQILELMLYAQAILVCIVELLDCCSMGNIKRELSLLLARVCHKYDCFEESDSISCFILPGLSNCLL